MPYVCELVGTGQTLYLDNQRTQTLVTLSSSSAGQQQQASSGYQTGTWTTPPQVYRTARGVVVKITTATGEYNLLLQDSSMSLTEEISVENSQQLQTKPVEKMPVSSMKPMEPMQPLKMGNMEMNLNTMEMKMGDMELKMGSAKTRNFCSQCGAKVKQNDRFCANCGHTLD